MLTSFASLQILRSQARLPYPKLEAIAQAFLNAYNQPALSEFVDAAGLSTQWGNEHLDLTGNNRHRLSRVEELGPSG
jgi:hypothetical protein